MITRNIFYEKKYRSEVLKSLFQNIKVDFILSMLTKYLKKSTLSTALFWSKRADVAERASISVFIITITKVAATYSLDSFDCS